MWYNHKLYTIYNFMKNVFLTEQSEQHINVQTTLNNCVSIDLIIY